MREDPRTANDSRSDRVVSALVEDLRPVAAVRLGREVATAVSLQVAAVLVTAWLIGARPAALERIGDPIFDAFLLILAVGAMTSARTMARLSIPGRVVESVPRLLVAALPVLLAGVVVLASPWGGTWTGVSAVVVEGIGCTRHTLLVAAPAWLVGLLVLRRLGPLDPFGVGLFASCAALFWSALAVQMACPSCDSWHLALSHYLPMVAAAWGAGLLSVPILRGSEATRLPDTARP